MSKKPYRNRRGRILAAFVCAAGVCAMALPAMGAEAGEGSVTASAKALSAASGSDLTVVEQESPSSLDPGRLNNGGGGAQYAELAYDPLIYLAPNGNYEPDLAASWSYVGTGNTEFVIHLRPGVQFSDGSTLTASDVVSSIKYAKSGDTTDLPTSAI